MRKVFGFIAGTTLAAVTVCSSIEGTALGDDFQAPRKARPSNHSLYRPAPDPSPSPTPSPDADGRTLSGHQFIKNGVTAFPLIAPYINMSLQGALESLTVSGADQPIKTVGISPSLLGQFRIGDFAVELGGQFEEIFGADSYSAYLVGANLVYGFTSGLKYEAVREENWAFTPVLNYTLNRGIGFSPLTVVSQNITSPTEATAQTLLVSTLDREVSLELLFAYAPTPEVGFSAELGMGFENSNVTGVTLSTTLARVGLAVDLNLGSEGIPLGLAAFYHDDIPTNQPGASSTSIVGGGIYDMVNKNFNFGIEVSELMSTNSSMAFRFSLTAYY